MFVRLYVSLVCIDYFTSLGHASRLTSAQTPLEQSNDLCDLDCTIIADKGLHFLSNVLNKL